MKRIQLEPWTTWEKLCLANAVQRTGDQNWTAVGRAVKNIYDDTMVYLGNEARPSHWFSMKQCAAQYETLLNSVLSSRRKKRTEKSADPHEQPSHIIYNILKNEFLEELDKKIEDDKMMYKKMKKKQEDILAGLYDDKLQDMIAEDAKEKERDIKLKLKFKLGEKNAAERNNSSSPVKSFTPTTPESEVVKTPGSNSSTSPLLTSLLQSPSQHSIPSTPTISLLLNSTPSTPTNESPTLSKLLESPSSKVPLNASSILNTASLPGVSSSSGLVLSGSSHFETLSRGLSPIKPAPISETTRISPSQKQPPQSSVNPVSAIENILRVGEAANTECKTEPCTVSQTEDKIETQDGIHSEIIIEEDLVGHEKKHIKKSDTEGDEEEEVTESVEEILEKLKEAIIETVGNEQDIEVIAEQVTQSEEVMHQISAPSIKQIQGDDIEEMESDDKNESRLRKDVVVHDDDDEEGGGNDESDKVFDDDDDKIDADILAEAKSVVDRRMSDSEVQDLSDVGGDQVVGKLNQQKDMNDFLPSGKDMSRSDSSSDQINLHSDQSATPVKDSEENIDLGMLDKQAVQIIVMGSNSNSVVNVLPQDSSSEDVMQMCSVALHSPAKDTSRRGQGVSVHELNLDKEDDEEEEEDDADDEQDENDEKLTLESPFVMGEEESQSSAYTEDKTREDKDYEEDKEEISSKEDETMQGDDGSSKDEHISSRDECGDSSSVPDTMADQEITSDSVQAPPSPPPISSRENLPEVKITLEPLDISLSQRALKEELRSTPVLDKIRRQSTRKRSSAHLDSKPTSPASTSFGDDEKEYRAWKKSVLLVFSRIASHKYASVFSKPIADTSGYRSLIKCPMDLSTIKRNIETGVIRSTLDFQRDIMLMLQNAVVYNIHDSPVYNMALEMWNDVISQMNVMVQAVGDGVVLGNLTAQGEIPSRPSRQAKQSLDSKTRSNQTPPSQPLPKRRKL